jgi:hypothetical protein
MAATATIMIISEFCASSRCRLSLSPYYPLGSLRRRLHTSYPSHSPLHRYREMVEMTWRRIHGNGDGADKAKSPTGAVGEREHHDHGLSNTQPHTHSALGSPNPTHMCTRIYGRMYLVCFSVYYSKAKRIFAWKHVALSRSVLWCTLLRNYTFSGCPFWGGSVGRPYGPLLPAGLGSVA